MALNHHYAVPESMIKKVPKSHGKTDPLIKQMARVWVDELAGYIYAATPDAAEAEAQRVLNKSRARNGMMLTSTELRSRERAISRSRINNKRQRLRENGL